MQDKSCKEAINITEGTIKYLCDDEKDIVPIRNLLAATTTIFQSLQWRRCTKILTEETFGSSGHYEPHMEIAASVREFSNVT